MSPKEVTLPLDLYLRVSDVRGRSGESFGSPELQEQACRRVLAERRPPIEAGQVFFDRDVSGGKMKRPALDQALARIKDGISGGIVVAKIDRFARTLVGGLLTLDEINKMGGVVIVADMGDGEPLNTASAQGEMVMNMMLTLAQYELRRIRENWDAQQKRAVGRGVHITRHVPPGYRRIEKEPNKGKLELDPVHAPTLRHAFEMAASGEPYARIAEMLTERGFPSGGQAAVWQANRIRRLLENRAYLGEARFGKSITNPEAHEPIVDLDTWATAQRKPAAAPSRKASALLAGIARCDCCRYALRGSKSSTRVSTYECRPNARPGERCEHPAYVSQKRLDNFILDQWLGRLDMTPSDSPIDNSASRLAVEDARRAIAEVQEEKSTLRPVAYAQALDVAMARLEEAERALPQTVRLDLPEATEIMQTTYREMAERFQAGETHRDLIDPDHIAVYRALIARDIQAVLVRPAASRNPNLPIEDRVSIVWADDEPLEGLPKRGKRGTKGSK